MHNITISGVVQTVIAEIEMKLRIDSLKVQCAEYSQLHSRELW